MEQNDNLTKRNHRDDAVSMAQDITKRHPEQILEMFQEIKTLILEHLQTDINGKEKDINLLTAVRNKVRDGDKPTL